MRDKSFSFKFNEPAIIAFMTGFSLALFMLFFGYQRYLLFKAQQDRLLENKLRNIEDRIEAALSNSLSATKTLSLFVTQYNGEQHFEIIAPQILQTHVYIDAIELVKSGVITHIYPLLGNEKAIGYNILTDSLRNLEALRTIERRELFFAGPFDLKQGYKAIVGRLPIFVDNRFCGFAAVIIKFSTFLDLAGLRSDNDPDFIYQLSKVDPNTDEEIFHLPNPEAFKNNSHYLSLNVREGNWKIYVKQKKSQLQLWMTPIIIIGLFVIVFSSLMAYSMAKQPIKLRQVVEEKTQEIRESEEKFRTLVESTQVGVFIEQNNKLIYMNPGFERIFGFSKKDLVNRNSFYDLLRTDTNEHSGNRIMLSSSSSSIVLKATRSDNEQIFIEAILSEIVFNKQPALMGTLVDITARVEHDVRVNKAVIEAQENERRQIGMELHDNVLQIMAASMLNIDYLQMKFKDNEDVFSTTASIKNYLNESIDEVRRLSHQLTPSVASGETLKDKIDTLLNNMGKSGNLHITTRVHDFIPPLSDEVQVGLYRILQEQLNNINKHSKATDISVQIRLENDQVILQIRDNGIGFNPQLPKSGIGLENIKRRARALGGETKIISSPGNGCEVLVNVPLS
jgi:PAS domain S-box-containing protein